MSCGVEEVVELAEVTSESLRLADLYDFLYVPFNLKTSRICGYAFINLVSSDAAAWLVSMWHQRKSLCGEHTDKAIFFSAADEQGFEAHVERLRKNNKRCLRDPRLRPFLSNQTRRIKDRHLELDTHLAANDINRGSVDKIGLGFTQLLA